LREAQGVGATFQSSSLLELAVRRSFKAKADQDQSKINLKSSINTFQLLMCFPARAGKNEFELMFILLNLSFYIRSN